MRVGSNKAAKRLGSMHGARMDASKNELSGGSRLGSSGGDMTGGSQNGLLSGSMTGKSYEDKHGDLERRKRKKKDFFSRFKRD